MFSFYFYYMVYFFKCLAHTHCWYVIWYYKLKDMYVLLLILTKTSVCLQYIEYKTRTRSNITLLIMPDQKLALITNSLSIFNQYILPPIIKYNRQWTLGWYKNYRLHGNTTIRVYHLIISKNSKNNTET